jgi:CRP/FNR family transcriptional regulator, polysaccharide utilization system transcription regulator
MNGYGDCNTCKSFPESSFSCMNRDTVSKSIIGSSVSINYRKGQEVFLEDTISKGVFCIQSGKVKMYKKCLDRNLTICLGGNSDLIGYGSLFNGGRYTHSAKCLENSQICFIPKKIFLNLVASDHLLLMRLMEQSCIENSKISNMLRDLKCKNTLSRMVCAIVNITEKYGLDENKCLNITLTRKEISELAGTTTESAIRILNELRREKLIVFDNSRIRVQDLNKLLRYK